MANAQAVSRWVARYRKEVQSFSAGRGSSSAVSSVSTAPLAFVEVELKHLLG
jgi:hypothetical protein